MCSNFAPRIRGSPHRHGEVRAGARQMSCREGRRKNCLVKDMDTIHDLEPRQPDTIVITSVDTLKTAFQQWTEEQEQQRRAAKREAMLDEETVLRRLGKSRTTLWRWNISGYLTRHKVGGKNCYKLSDIERIEGGRKK